MQPSEVAAFLQRYAVDPWTSGDLESLDDLVSEGYVLHPDYTLDDLKEVIRSTRHDLTDLTVTIEDPITDDDRIAYRWMMRGSYQGDHGDPSQVGRVVTYTGMTMLRLHDGKVIEDRYESSSPTLEQQLAADA